MGGWVNRETTWSLVFAAGWCEFLLFSKIKNHIQLTTTITPLFLSFSFGQTSLSAPHQPSSPSPAVPPRAATPRKHTAWSASLRCPAACKQTAASLPMTAGATGITIAKGKRAKQRLRMFGSMTRRGREGNLMARRGRGRVVGEGYGEEHKSGMALRKGIGIGIGRCFVVAVVVVRIKSDLLYLSEYHRKCPAA